MKLIQYAAVIALISDISQIISIVVPFVLAHPIISLIISNIVTAILLYKQTKKDQSPSHDRSAA